MNDAQELLLEEESSLNRCVARWMEEVLGRFRRRERKRSRARVVELNHFNDSMRQADEDELDVLPPPGHAGLGLDDGEPGGGANILIDS